MKNKAAQQLGRLGGKVTSEAKASAVRENGKMGGRPLTLTSSERNRLLKGETITIERRGESIVVELGDFGEYTFNGRFRSLAQAVFAAKEKPQPTQAQIDATLATAGWIKQPDGSYLEK